MTTVAQPLQARPQGAFRSPQADQPDTVTFCLWAPRHQSVVLRLGNFDVEQSLPMQPVGDGYFELTRPGVPTGTRYGYQPGGEGMIYPDPASRWQPDGVHRPSAVFLPDEYEWGDRRWPGVTMRDLVIYELHVGTFTPEGTFAAITPRLAELVDLGITAIELMPVWQFPGGRNWGYDGVHPFAVQNTYGGPRALQQLVDAAHAAGLAVIQDCVHNHFGPEGNYTGQFGPYDSDRYHTPWGPALNFDGPLSDPVRQFVIDNAVMWIRDFHMDGLRLDAVQSIFDNSAHHILAELQVAVEQAAAAAGRSAVVIGETDQNDGRLMAPADQWGYGLCGTWSDDFHHGVHALLTGERDGYYMDFGQADDVVKALNNSYVYDGVSSRYYRRRHGNRPTGIPRERFVACIQNHDQVGNRPWGDRLSTLIGPEALRMAAALLLLNVDTPLLFMGEEYGETHPFAFFCSYGDPALIKGVREGRRREFSELAFKWVGDIPDANEASTFERAKLSWQWDDPTRGGLRRLYRTLLGARRSCPALGDREHVAARLVDVGGGPLLVIDRGVQGELRAVANLSAEAVVVPGDLPGGRVSLLSTAEARFGGNRCELTTDTLHPHELMIWGDATWTMLSR